MVENLVSNRLNGIGEYYFSKKLREIDELNKEGFEIFNLGIGSPDLEPPASVKKALVESLNDPHFHRYQSYKGIPELRDSFAKWYQRHYDVNLESESEILPLIGSKEGIMHVSMAFVNAGDEVLVPNPGYPTYSAAVRLAGGTPRYYHLNEQNGYLPELESLGELDKVKMMWINYPHMPTGKSASEAELLKILEFCTRNDIILVNDNPYSFTLTDKPISILKNRKKSDLVMELNSLSKSHNMAGWRIGMLGGNENLIAKTLVFKSNMDSGMFKPVMQAAIEALGQEQSWYESVNTLYSQRRKLVHQIADKLGCEYARDQVGMFIWAKIPNGESSGEHFADKILEKYKFFVPPGMVFGSEGDRYIRFSLCSQPEVLETVLKRIN